MTEQEGPQDEVAQVWLLRHDPAQLRDRNCEYPPCGGGDGAQEGALPGEHADLAEKFRRTIAGDDTCPGLAVTLDDVGRAREQDDQVVGLVAVSEQHIPGSHVAFAAVPAQYSKLSRIQDRRTPRRRDQAIVAAVGRLRGSSRSSASQPGCGGAHRNLLTDGRGYEDTSWPPDGQGAADAWTPLRHAGVRAPWRRAAPATWAATRSLFGDGRSLRS